LAGIVVAQRAEMELLHPTEGMVHPAEAGQDMEREAFLVCSGLGVVSGQYLSEHLVQSGCVQTRPIRLTVRGPGQAMIRDPASEAMKILHPLPQSREQIVDVFDLHCCGLAQS